MVGPLVRCFGFVTLYFMNLPVGVLASGIAVVDRFACRAFFEVVAVPAAGGAGATIRRTECGGGGGG